MSPNRLATCLLVTSLSACTRDDGLVSEDGVTSDGDDVPVDDVSVWDGASLDVRSPASGDILPWEEDARFEAVVLDADGGPTDFEDIAWTSDIDEAWEGVGSSFEDDGLDVGVHTLTVDAVLPNGDHLQTQLAMIRVQHPDAGIYAGNIIVDLAAEYGGTEYTASCVGAVTIIVEAHGETAGGESQCIASLLGYELDSQYLFDLSVDDGDIRGDAIIDLFGYLELGMAAEGEVDDGDLTASWAGSLAGLADIAGQLSTTRVSYDTELPD